MEYRLIAANDINKLNTAVNKLLKEEWDLHGSPTCSNAMASNKSTTRGSSTSHQSYLPSND